MSSWEQSIPIAQSGRLEVEHYSGAVQIKGWNEPHLLLRAHGEGDDPVERRIRIDQGTESVTVAVRPPDRSRFWFGGRSDRIDLQVMVPVGVRVRVENGSGPVENGSGPVVVAETAASVEVETGSGSIQIKDARGRVYAESGSGSVALERVEGKVDVDTGSGGLVISQSAGEISAETGSGSVRASQVSGRSLVLQTGSGSIQVKEVSVERLNLDTGSGSVEAELLTVAPGGQYWIECGSGRVAVTLPVNADLEVSAEADSGQIEYKGFTFSRIRREDETLEATMGRGGSRLTICTSGSIRLLPGQGLNPLRQLLRDDPALESSAPVRRVLEMVQAGKLSADEGAAILKALDEED